MKILFWLDFCLQKDVELHRLIGLICIPLESYFDVFN